MHVSLKKDNIYINLFWLSHLILSTQLEPWKDWADIIISTLDMRKLR